LSCVKVEERNTKIDVVALEIGRPRKQIGVLLYRNCCYISKVENKFRKKVIYDENRSCSMRDREAAEEADLAFVVQKCRCGRKLKKYFGRSL
jgi:hypothetical protein